ncbi:hypothetical protein FYL58_03210 [Klebsiella aerogenes]|uniref:hypothetical protein n=1 Tax=Klebsiella aerogenes TaxID=548 RepID=UPI0012F66FA8|nr:hypothetical protein [Klebsiella aerogenes]EIW9476395.1 hypothetical protein [Klebsiella aerogenes]EIW9496598.1 hypothetical protein [Klebsiella aerogenes]KAE9488383.1 hypothetical protein F8B42_04282 [Klebsiella aerogenes]HDS6535398.1 hypothetical protein [Klebsiella aerogenes]HDT1528534.1 hypothetical protein [Klebsiella aerogenes]
MNRKFIGLTMGMLALLPTLANGAQITMTNPQEEQTENGKTLCIYENSIYLFTLVTRSQTCPYSKTFDTEDNDK